MEVLSIFLPFALGFLGPAGIKIIQSDSKDGTLQFFRFSLYVCTQALMMWLLSHFVSLFLPPTLPVNEEHKQKLNCSYLLNIDLSAQ